MALERLPESRKYVGQWSEERHQRTMMGGDARYLVAGTQGGPLQAFAILRGLEESTRAIELKRIVVGAPGQGTGRVILRELMQIVFEDLHAHRMFLDVFDDNPRARHVYEQAGFVYEGLLREAAMRDGAYYSLHLMSMLEHEYRARISLKASVAEQ